jgi:NADPH-dependent 2,4-dienoyl-CoA reductase/sulfur reductase-like enzyme/nitrite reductase/ring-hydroxylating ferredoxin subunit
MPDSSWKRVAGIDDLEDGTPIEVTVDEQEVAVCRVGDEILACGSSCPHYGGPLSEGFEHAGTLHCPWHNAAFDMRTGTAVRPPALDGVPVYQVRVEGEDVYIGGATEPVLEMPAGSDDRTFLIVGAGAAGNAAAETLRREGFAGRIVLATADSEPPYDRPMLSKQYIAGNATDDMLPLRSASFYERLQIDIRTNHAATELEPSALRVSFENGSAVHGDAILLATGGRPRRLELPGMDSPGCFVLRSVADARAITEGIRGANQVVLLGASFIAMECAASLTQRGIRVHVVAPEDVPLERVFGTHVGKRLMALHTDKGVSFHMGCTATEVLGDGKVSGVVLADGTRLEADAVIVGVGVEPVVDFLSGTGLVADGAIPVNERLEATAGAVFAAADIARYPDPRSGRPVRVEHWVAAEQQGRHAARSMLGHTEPFTAVPFFWSMQFGTPIKYVGYADEFDEMGYRGDLESGAFLSGYFWKDSLLAAASIGMGRDIAAIGRLLSQRRTVSRDQFLSPELDLAELLD